MIPLCLYKFRFTLYVMYYNENLWTWRLSKQAVDDLLDEASDVPQFGTVSYTVFTGIPAIRKYLTIKRNLKKLHNKHKRYAMSHGDAERFKDYFENASEVIKCFDDAKDNAVNGWQEKFLDDLSTKFLQFGMKTFITKKQYGTLIDLANW
jgi:hypothetical protein